MKTGHFTKASTTPQKSPKGQAEGSELHRQIPHPKKAVSQSHPKQFHGGKNGEFVKLAPIAKFGHGKVAILTKHVSYNDDLSLGCFTQSKLVRVDSQKKSAFPGDYGPLSYTDHILREVSAEFPLGVDIPLPGDVVSSLDWLASAPP